MQSPNCSYIDDAKWDIVIPVLAWYIVQFPAGIMHTQRSSKTVIVIVSPDDPCAKVLFSLAWGELLVHVGECGMQKEKREIRVRQVQALTP